MRFNREGENVLGEYDFITAEILPEKVERFRPVDIIVGKRGEIYIYQMILVEKMAG